MHESETVAQGSILDRILDGNLDADMCVLIWFAVGAQVIGSPFTSGLKLNRSESIQFDYLLLPFAVDI